jgi:manganese/zinc/iron transport system permease protein
VVALLAFWKEFEMVTFDREFALANGYPVRSIELLLISLTVVAIVLGLQLAGVVLMVGLLIAPGVAARQLTRNLAQMVLLSGVFGGIAGTTGAVLSALGEGLPTGPLIILVASAIVFTVILFAPQRGIVWMTLQQRRHRLQLSMRHILRDVHRYALEHGGSASPFQSRCCEHCADARHAWACACWSNKGCWNRSAQAGG